MPRAPESTTTAPDRIGALKRPVSGKRLAGAVHATFEPKNVENIQFGEDSTEFRLRYRPRKRTKDDLEVRVRFNEVDSDRSGAIDRKELTDALKQMGKYESEIQIDDLMGTIDKDGNGRIELRELIDYIEETRKIVGPTPDERAAYALFASLVEEGAKTISRDKVSAMLAEEFGLDAGSFDVLYEGYDQNIDKESFAKIIVDVTA